MAQTERSTGLLIQDTNSAGIIASLRTYIAAGSIIRSTDINTIVYLINNMYGHAHYHNDYAQLPTYGNTGDRTSYERINVTTSNTFIDGVGYLYNNGSTVGVSGGDIITAARHNHFNTMLAKVRSHTHQASDFTTTAG